MNIFMVNLFTGFTAFDFITINSQLSACFTSAQRAEVSVFFIRLEDRAA